MLPFKQNARSDMTMQTGEESGGKIYKQCTNILLKMHVQLKRCAIECKAKKTTVLFSGEMCDLGRRDKNIGVYRK